MKKILLTSAFISLACALYSQQLPQVSHFMYDNVRTNPGSVGSMDMICVNGIYREQMAGFPGNPKNFFLNADVPFKLFNVNHGAGLAVYSDLIGFNVDINVNLSYAFRISLGKGKLGIGINGGFFQKDLDDSYNWNYPGDGPASGNDPKIPQGSSDKMALNIGAGLFYRSDDIYFGASVLNINTPEIHTPAQEDNSGDSEYILNRHYYITSGYNMQLTNPAWELKPALLLKSDGIATDMDINLTVAYNKKFWGGVTYRTGAAVVGLIGVEIIEGLKLGFAYDFATSAISKHTKLSYEILLNYCFKIGVEKDPQKYKSIRYL